MVTAFATGFGVLGLIVALLLYWLWRSSRALESKHIDAERQATQDPLTRLPNRLSFERQFDRILRLPAAQPGEVLGAFGAAGFHLLGWTMVVFVFVAIDGSGRTRSVPPRAR